MPFGAISKPAAAAGPVVKVGIDACLTHARANASAGDVYQDSNTGACFAYDASGSGILVPAEWSGNTLTLLTNATGAPSGAYITLADEESDVGGNPVSGRGFLLVESGGTISKTASNPLVMTATSSGHYTYITYTPSTTPTTSKKYLMVVKVEASAAPGTSNYLNLWFCGPSGGKIRALCPDASGVAGDYSWAESGSNLEGTSAMSVGTAATWIAVYYGAAGEGLTARDMTAAESTAVALPADMTAASGTYQDCLYLGTYTGSASAATLKIYELFLFEVT